MNFFLKNKIFASLSLSLIIGGSLFSPFVAFSATDYKSGGVASTDCPEITEITAEITTAITSFYTLMTGQKLKDKTSVPTDTGAAATGAGAAGAEQTGSTMWDSFIQPLGKCIMYKTGQKMLDQFTQQTVDWIKSGMNGSPYYAIDTKKLETDLADAVAGNLARQIQSYELCSFSNTWINDLANWMIMGQAEPAPVFRAALKCPLDPMTASEFYSGVQEFTWETFETSLNDNGNPFGVTVIAGNELTKRQKDEASRAKQALDWGQGFMGVIDESDCQWPDEMTEQAVMNSASIDSDTGATLSDEAKSAYKRAYCKTTTPAKLIEKQLTNATDIEWARLGAADDINKIINAFVTKVSNDAIKGIFKK